MDQDDLTQVLDQYPVHWRSGQLESLGGAGGFSGARFWRLAIGGQRLCLRRWPSEHPRRARLESIHRVLQHVHAAGLTCVAVPWPTRHRTTIAEASDQLWELTRWMPGQADYCRNPNRAKLAAAMMVLARFHQAAAAVSGHSTQSAVSPGILRRQRRLRHGMQGGADRLAAAIRARSVTPLAAPARRVLTLFRQLAPRVLPTVERAAELRVPMQACIRDIWHDHVLFTGDRVTGLVDFGAVDHETIAGDIARLLGSMVADDPTGWQFGLAAYQTIEPLSDHQRCLITAFDWGNVTLSGLQWIEWIFAEGRHFENQDQVLARLRHIISRMQSLLVETTKTTPASVLAKRAELW